MTDTIQEFLVKIKYSEDTNSRNSMLSGLKSTAGTITSIAEKAVGLAALVGAATYKIAKEVNSLYLTSHNLGNSTIRTFKSMTEAAQDVGSSIDEMTNSLEGLQKFRRMTGEGANQFLRQFAPDISSKDSAPDAMLKIIKNIPALKASGMREEQFLAAMDVTGMGYDVGYKAWENPEEFLKQQGKHEAAIGTGTDRMAPDIHAQMERFSLDMDKALSSAANNFGEAFQKAVDLELQGFEKLINGFDIAGAEFKDAFHEYSEKLGEKFDKLDLSMNGINKSLETLTHPLEYLKIAIEGLGVVFAGKFLYDVMKGMSFRKGGAGGVAIGAAEIFAKDFLMKRVFGTIIGGYLTGQAIGNLIPDEYKEQFVEGAIGTDENNESRAERAANAMARWGNKSNKPEDVKTREQAAMEYFQNVGMSKIDAAAVMGSLHKETGSLDPFAEGDNGEAYGIEQWHKDRQKLYRSYFGHTMQSVVDPNQAYAEQLEFINFERNHSEKENWAKMQEAANDPYQRGAAYSQYIVRPGLTDEAKRSEADARGIEALGVAQQYGDVHINVNGVTDPKQAADIVLEKLNNKNKMNSRYQQMSHQ